MDVPQKYVDTIMSAHSEEIVWLSKEDIARDFDGLIRQYDEWFRADCPTLTEFQLSEDERLVQKHRRGQQWTACRERVVVERRPHPERPKKIARLRNLRKPKNAIGKG